MKKLQDVGTFLICLTIAFVIVTTVNYREQCDYETNNVESVSDNNIYETEETTDKQEINNKENGEDSKDCITNINVNWMLHKCLENAKEVYSISEVYLDTYGSSGKDISDYTEESKDLEVVETKNVKYEDVKVESKPTPEPISEQEYKEIVAVYSVSSGDAASRETFGITGKIYETFGQDELELFFRIVQAEIGDEHTFDQKVNVATVILNRVNSEHFPNTLYDVLTAKRQFSTYSSGRYKKVTVSDITILACEYAYEIGGSEVGNALFFDSNGVLKYKKICNDGAHNFYIKSSWE